MMVSFPQVAHRKIPLVLVLQRIGPAAVKVIAAMADLPPLLDRLIKSMMNRTFTSKTTATMIRTCAAHGRIPAFNNKSSNNLCGHKKTDKQTPHGTTRHATTLKISHRIVTQTIVSAIFTTKIPAGNPPAKSISVANIVTLKKTRKTFEGRWEDNKAHERSSMIST
jgi:hypothetical protein